MSLGTVLDVVIGLAFTYLLLGILASGVQELFAGLVKLRGKALRDGIAQLLVGKDRQGGPSQLFEAVFGHPFIAESSRGRLPSYVSARSFALALMEALKDGTQSPLFSQMEASVSALPAGAAKTSLTTLLTHAGGDLDAFQKKIETWFDDQMDRVTGSYKRFTQYFTLAFGILIAVTLNVDSITLARALWTEPATREAMTSLAEAYVESHQATELGTQIEDARKGLDALPLPIGWHDTDADLDRSAWALFVDRVFAADASGLWLVIGWLITGLAVSIGAPFWFDALKQLLNLRNAGPKPERSDVAATGQEATK